MVADAACRGFGAARGLRGARPRVERAGGLVGDWSKCRNNSMRSTASSFPAARARRCSSSWRQLPCGQALERFHAQGKPLFGTCAGLILLARETRSPVQESLGMIDIVAERNAYGRQIDSFVGQGEPLVQDLQPPPLEMVFIRGSENRVLAGDGHAARLLPRRCRFGAARQCHGGVLPSRTHHGSPACINTFWI